MTLSRTPPVVTTAGLDTDIRITIYVDPALGFPAGLHAIVQIPHSDGSIGDATDLLLSTVPRTLSGITGVQGANLMKDIAVAARTALGYA